MTRNMRVFPINMPDKMRTAIDHETAGNNMSLAQFVRMAVDEKLQRLAGQRKATAEAIERHAEGLLKKAEAEADAED